MNLKDYFPIWDKLSEAQQKQMMDAATTRTVSKGTTLNEGGDNCIGLLLVVSGQLRIYTISEEGHEITIYRLFERDICLFSASCMMHSLQVDMMIEAEKDSEIIQIPTNVYRGIMDESAPLANYTNEIMASRFSDVMWLLEQILWKSFDKRLAGFLLEEAAIEDTDSLKITHETIGNHLGHPREVVTRMLRYFQSEGMVHLSRGVIELTDKQKLHEISSK